MGLVRAHLPYIIIRLMLKQLTLYLTIVLLMVFTIGVHVSVRFCGGEYVGVSVNGVLFLSEAGEEMSCCSGEDGRCDACHHIHCQYQVQSPYEGAEVLSIAPSLYGQDWLHGFFQGLLSEVVSLDTVEEDGDDDAGFWYHPPGYSPWTGISFGLRAPPMCA